jgi:hypothetical protein
MSRGLAREPLEEATEPTKNFTAATSCASVAMASPTPWAPSAAALGAKAPGATAEPAKPLALETVEFEAFACGEGKLGAAPNGPVPEAWAGPWLGPIPSDAMDAKLPPGGLTRGGATTEGPLGAGPDGRGVGTETRADAARLPLGAVVAPNAVGLPGLLPGWPGSGAGLATPSRGVVAAAAASLAAGGGAGLARLLSIELSPAAGTLLLSLGLASFLSGDSLGSCWVISEFASDAWNCWVISVCLRDFSAHRRHSSSSRSAMVKLQREPSTFSAVQRSLKWWGNAPGTSPRGLK